MRFSRFALLVLVGTLSLARTAMADVACVQDVLRMHSYDPGPVDGVLGPRTRDMARNFAADNGVTLPPLNAQTADDYCAAFQQVALGAGLPLDPALVRDRPLGCITDPPSGFAQEITSTLDGDPLTLRVSDRFGGAVGSVRWRGKEFINIYDHGRQISYAWHLDGWGECLNPTEPGAAADNFAQTSTTQLQEVCATAANRLRTRARPAFWLAPGETGFCDNGATTALNTGVLSGQTFEKTITLGYRGLENVIAFDATITLERDYASLQTEMPTAYLAHDFTARYTFDPLSGTVTPAQAHAAVPPWSFRHAGKLPPILATPDGAFAMGAYTAAPIETYEILFYDVPNPADRTNKWNMVIREEPAPAGPYRYQSFAIVGTLAQVQSAMQALFKMHPTDLNPPTGYVDVANCEQISGWAWDPKAPDVPVIIDIFDVRRDGTRDLIFSKEASDLRRDLLPVLGDNGKHGFRFWTYQVITDTKPHVLEVEARTAQDGLPNAALIPAQVKLDC